MTTLGELLTQKLQEQLKETVQGGTPIPSGQPQKDVLPDIALPSEEEIRDALNKQKESWTSNKGEDSLMDDLDLLFTGNVPKDKGEEKEKKVNLFWSRGRVCWTCQCRKSKTRP